MASRCSSASSHSPATARTAPRWYRASASPSSAATRASSAARSLPAASSFRPMRPSGAAGAGVVLVPPGQLAGALDVGRVAARGEDVGQLDRGVDVVWVVGEHGLELLPRRRVVAERAEALGRRHGVVGLRRHEDVEEGAHLVFGLRAGELAGHAPALEGLDRGDALHAELLGHHRVLVDVDLHELHAPGVLVRELLEDRAEDVARLTPRRPEVDDDRHLVRAPQHDVGERRVGGFEHGSGGHRFPLVRPQGTAPRAAVQSPGVTPPATPRGSPRRSAAPAPAHPRSVAGAAR